MANRFLNTMGKHTLAIAICQRCHRKMSHAEMVKDPNTGLRMHEECVDELDRYKLPPRQADRIALSFVLRDVPLTAGPTETQIPTDPGGGPGPGPGPGPSNGDFGTDFSNDFSGGIGTGGEEPPPDTEEPPPSNGAGDFSNDYNSDFS